MELLTLCHTSTMLGCFRKLISIKDNDFVEECCGRCGCGQPTNAGADYDATPGGFCGSCHHLWRCLLRTYGAHSRKASRSPTGRTQTVGQKSLDRRERWPTAPAASVATSTPACLPASDPFLTTLAAI